jgi:diguanylate cyclase (GGDEF)-like protein
LAAVEGVVLHPPTLLFSLGVVGLASGALFMCIASALPRHRGALVAWSQAMALGGLGFMLLFLRGRAPLVLTFLLADLLMLCLAWGIHEAHARLLDAVARRRWPLAWCGAGALGVLLAWLLELPVQVGFTTVSLAFAGVMALTARLILRSRGVVRHSRAALAALLCYAGLSLVFAVRFVVGLAGSGEQLQPGAMSLAQLLSLVPGAMLVVFCPVWFLSMVHERQLREAEETARRDELTGLFNRAGLKRLIGEMESAPVAAREPYAVAMFDIDHFKAINDAYGHGGGDAVLVHAGRLIAGKARLADFVCRYGGEEFCVLLRGCDAAEAAAFARRVVEEAGTQEVRLPGGELATFTLSAGYAAHPGRGGATVATVIDRADAALYAAKRAGRNQAMGEVVS